MGRPPLPPFTEESAIQKVCGRRRMEQPRPIACRARLHGRQPLAQSSGIPARPRRDRGVPDPQMGARTRLSADQGTLDLRRQPYRRALRLRISHRPGGGARPAPAACAALCVAMDGGRQPTSMVLLVSIGWRRGFGAAPAMMVPRRRGATNTTLAIALTSSLWNLARERRVESQSTQLSIPPVSAATPYLRSVGRPDRPTAIGVPNRIITKKNWPGRSAAAAPARAGRATKCAPESSATPRQGIKITSSPAGNVGERARRRRYPQCCGICRSIVDDPVARSARPAPAPSPPDQAKPTSPASSSVAPIARAPSSAPESANNNSAKKNCRRRPAAPRSRPVQVGRRQSLLDRRPPRARA